ncbi:MAG: GH92 family glycosyl hydrolase [Bacteroides sp.]|nr:GH92 family glycosyl hydrolase [Bacteroides sp.]MCM1413193.1 GH92 family glycosyl hydrolase [Bacteroides sp.]MCM1472065.1 GH92 family glycosyl hydrolase [Bacteroides sp.]
MKFYHLFISATMAMTTWSCGNSNADTTQADTTDYTQYVDPKIGSGGHGHVFVGANVPFGMVQLGPTSVPQTWDWCSGYHDSDSTIIGFSHTHLEGTGIGDLFDVTVMPVVGDVTYARGEVDKEKSGLWSYGDRSKEIAVPGYYSIPLTRYGIQAEMTATNRVGLHRYTFPQSDESAIVIDLQNGGCWDEATETSMTPEGNNRIVGYRYSKGWAKDQKVYFVAEFSKPFDSFELKGEKNMYGRASFKTTDGEQVLMKVAISPVSIDGAKANLAAEMPGFDFEGTRKAANEAWNNELSKVKVTTDDADQLKKFYTSLYHTMIVPATFSDVDGQYRGADGKVYKSETPQYTIFSLWDTYRAQMPLMSILQPERSSEMINTMVNIAEQQGRLPVWHLWGNETDCMVGNPGIIAVADAIVKGQTGFDREKAYQALLKTAADTARGGGLRQQYGFIPSDMFNESIAYDMEYAVADAAVAAAAKAMGDTANYRKFTERSHSWRNYFDKSTGFVRGKFADGQWRTPFDPNATTHREDDYCEGNAWQYTWLVPQDLDGLVSLYGSKEATIEHLDELFTTSSELTGDNASPDITGLIGQYAHGNEPGHHTIYLYTMLGENDKAADRINQVREEFYTTKPDGLAGNEDAGQMSAWYIMSTFGFYEVEPASGRYWFGAPAFEKVEFAVPGGQFVVRAENLSADNRYIRGVKLNGKKYDKMYIDHADIMAGGELVFEMGPKK